ncbi:hypothetical protein [Streptomyces sp. NPDC008139]|uniref:hypothetical protein n=1 Tax=Streptomyces sp. NPDC008139 TaxID=3364814 RepID=UPI0036ECD159
MSQAVYLHAPDIFVPGGAVVGEGPVVDLRTGELAWVDIPSGAWRAALTGRGSAEAARIGMSLGAVAVRDRAGYVAGVGTFAG